VLVTNPNPTESGSGFFGQRIRSMKVSESSSPDPGAVARLSQINQYFVKFDSIFCIFVQINFPLRFAVLKQTFRLIRACRFLSHSNFPSFYLLTCSFLLGNKSKVVENEFPSARIWIRIRMNPVKSRIRDLPSIRRTLTRHEAKWAAKALARAAPL
jgi:hypothetical protein